MKIGFGLPLWISRFLFPDLINAASDAAMIHGEAKRNKRWWHGFIEVNVTARNIDRD